MLQCANEIAEFCLKCMGLISGLLIFFMPLLYYRRLSREVKKSIKLRNDALNQLCNSDPNWIKDDNPIFDTINDAVKPFSFINILSQELFSINLFENNEPAENSGLKDCKMLPMYNLNHFLELYNKSLLSGFWSLILKPNTLLDKNHFKIIALKDKEDVSIHIIIIMDFEKEYIRFFQFIINSK